MFTEVVRVGLFRCYQRITLQFQISQKQLLYVTTSHQTGRVEQNLLYGKSYLSQVGL